MNKFCKYLSVMALTSSLVVHASVMAAEKEQPGHLVSVKKVKNEQVNPTLWLPGNVISRMNAPISAEQMGQLLWIEDVGRQVEKGQVIAKIDHRHLQLQLSGQQAQIKRYQADVVYLTSQKQRMSALSQKNNTAISELERITKDLAVAQSEVLELTMLIKQTELAIEKTEIIAPFSGNISQRFAHVGELIAVGRSLVQLVDTNNLDIMIAAPIAIAPFLNKNAKVLVKWQDKLIELPLRTWSKAGVQSSRTFDVRLDAKNLALLAGTAVTVSLPKAQVSQATLVPRDALVLREKETFVLTVDEESNAKKINVLVGQGSGNWVSVSGAIWAGDEVIIRGGERLQEGEKVRKGESLVAQQ